MLIDDLKAIQERFGFLPEAEIRTYSDRTNTPLYQIQAVASFYPHFLLEPPPEVEVKVCLDLACHMRGAPELHRRLLGIDRPAERLQVHPCSCLGQCDAAPALLINDVPVRNADTLEVEALIDGVAEAPAAA